MKRDIIKKFANVNFPDGNTYSIMKVVDEQHLQITLREEGKNEEVYILFENPVAYRSIDSSFLDKIWLSIDDDLRGNVIYEYENSTFIEYIHDMSHGIYSDFPIRHFAIYGGEVAVDVLSVKEPKVFVQ